MAERSTHSLWRDFMWAMNKLFYACVGLFIGLFLYGLLPEAMQSSVVDKLLKAVGQYDVTTTEIHSSVEPFEKAPKFIVGHQVIHDSLVIKHKKPLCNPASYAIIFTRKAQYIYDIDDGKLEITFVTDSIRYHDQPSGGKGYCDYSAPKFTFEQVEALKDSVYTTAQFNSGYEEAQARELISQYIKQEYIKWTDTIKL